MERTLVKSIALKPQPEHQGVIVGLDETGDHRQTLQVPYLRPSPDRLFHPVIGPDPENPSILHRHPLGPGGFAI